MTIPEGKKRKVLIVSYGFPPANTSGAVRVGKMAKYLPQFGWEPIVLTAGKRRDVSQTLPVEIDEANVIRTPFPELGWTIGRISAALPILRMIVPYPMGWYHHALKAGTKLLQKHNFAAIFSSYHPSASHFIASRLQQRTGLPWIAEFRDPWSFTPYSKKIWLSESLEKRIEKRVMRNSCLLIAVSELDARQLQEIHHKKVAVIPNGFDEGDYVEEIPLTSKFSITYTGNIYVGQRDPTLLFEALAQLRIDDKISPDSFEVRFFGGSSLNSLLPTIKNYHLEDIVKIYGFVPFKESVRKQKESTVLLLLSWNDPRDKGTYTGKVFEYLGARRPILAIAYKTGAIDRLLRETGAGIVVNEITEIKDVIIRWLEEWCQLGRIESYWNPSPHVVKKYTRKEQAGRLAQLLEETCSYTA